MSLWGPLKNDIPSCGLDSIIYIREILHTHMHACMHTHTHTSILRPSGLCSGFRWAGTRTNLDFTEARDSEW